MLRSLSQIFNGPAVEKVGKEMPGPVDEASTAPGSSGEEASEGADGASDMSTEEPPPPHDFDGEPAVGEAQSGTEGESAEVPKELVCAQVAAAGARVAEDWPVCVDTTERRMTRIEEGDGNGERGMDFALTAAADDANIVHGGLVQKPTPASQTGDGQARRRALKRYKADGGQFVKGRAGESGAWLPEPGALAFPTLEAAMEYERHNTLLRPGQ